MEAKATPYEALQAAVTLVGSQSAFARLLGVGQPAVWKWLQSSKRLPPQHVLKVEQVTGISRHLLRPDIFSGEDVAATTILVPGDRRNVSQQARRA